MSKLQEYIAALVDEYLGKELSPVVDVGDVVGHAVETSPENIAVTVSSVESVEELPIYEATPAEINYWHAHGYYIPLQNFLSDFGLSGFQDVRAYNKLKIGYDPKRNAATFALDETTYYKIDFDDRCCPANRRDAQKVMAKILERLGR